MSEEKLPEKTEIPSQPEASKPKRRLLKKTQKEEPEEKSPKKRSKRIILFVCIVLLFFSALIIVPLVSAWWYLSSFAEASATSPNVLLSSARASLQTSLANENNRTNFLILGLDEINGQREGSLLTDTLIIASYDSNQKDIHLIPLPRDLWIDAFKTKINAIYYYGEISEDTTGQEFITSVVTDVTGLPIHYSFVLSLDSLKEIIDALGGITLDVPVGFSDDKFPRGDVDLSTASLDELYETVSFETGVQTMSGDRALKYIRSRQSENLDEGTDLARSRRQQHVIQAIISKATSRDILQNPRILGSVYASFRSTIPFEVISDAELLSFLRLNGTNIPEMNNISFPIKDDEQDGVLINPPIEKYKQWVYEPVDPSWGEVKDFLKGELGD